MKQRWVWTTPTDNSTLPVWFHSVVRHLEKIFLWRMDLSHNPLTLQPIRDGRDMSLLPDKGSPAAPWAALRREHIPGLPPEPGICAISSVKMCLDTESCDTVLYHRDKRASPLPRRQMPGAGCWAQGPSWAFCLLFNPAWQSRLQGALFWKINIAFLVQKLQAILLFFFSLTKKDCNFSFLGEVLCGNALTWRGLENSCWTFRALPLQTSLSSLSALATVLKFSSLKNPNNLL